MKKASVFSPRRSAQVGAWGEEHLISQIRRWLGSVTPPSPFGIGDDCAVLAASKGRQLLTVDPVVYGRHFDSSVSPRDVGAKLLKRNISDIAAMGGRPASAVISLTLDPRVSQDWLEAFYRGLASEARSYRIAIVGGDIAQASGGFCASLTLLGEAGPRILARTGARMADWIYVSGVLGGSLKSGHHFSFIPRLEQGSWCAKQTAVRAVMDVSDGLAKDIWALTPEGATPAVASSSVPVRRGCTLKEALCDGEDYELLMVVSARANRTAFIRDWERAFPKVPLSCIGRFVRPGEETSDSVDFSLYQGFEHLRIPRGRRR